MLGHERLKVQRYPGLRNEPIFARKKTPSAIKYSRLRSYLLVTDINTGPDTAKTRAKMVINCPATPTETPKSSEITGRIPPIINSTNPTTNAEIARTYTLKFMLSTLQKRKTRVLVYLTCYSTTIKAT